MGMPFLENLAAADLILTTSVAEGFGLVFLESWLAGKRLVGRDLPEITADFVASGVCLDGLRSRVSIPVDWLGVDEIFMVLREAFSAAREAYLLPPVTDEQFSREFRDLVEDETIDFACLNSEMQRNVIRMARDSEQQRNELRVLNPWISNSPALTDASPISTNAAAVRNGYSVEIAGKRLRTIYNAVLTSGASSIEAPKAGHRLLDSFLELSRLHPIRLES